MTLHPGAIGRGPLPAADPDGAEAFRRAPRTAFLTDPYGHSPALMQETPKGHEPRD